jgi:REP element-mobilizing transposase RayT
MSFLPETYHHLYNHANGTENLFIEERNYAFFLKKYALYIPPVAHTFAYCLLPNHFHFLIQVKPLPLLLAYARQKKALERGCAIEEIQIDETSVDASSFVSQQFSNFFNSYAKSYNKVYRRKGSLFLENVKRKEIEHATYFQNVLQYIHKNPVHHGFVTKPEDWPYSSYAAIVSTKPTKVCRNEVLERFGGKTEFITYHQQAIKRIEYLP